MLWKLDNIFPYLLCLQFALPYLRKTKGNIINLASLVGIIGQKYAVPYVATKVSQKQAWRVMSTHLTPQYRT